MRGVCESGLYRTPGSRAFDGWWRSLAPDTKRGKKYNTLDHGSILRQPQPRRSKRSCGTSGRSGSCDGRTRSPGVMKEIADILGVSEKTVMFHKYEIMKSLNIKNNAELVLLALKSGLISN